MQDVIVCALHKTNQNLLESEINTELSGSTVIAIFIYHNEIICFNVGDSRAVLASYGNDQKWNVKGLS